MMKKLISMIVALAMLVSFVPATALRASAATSPRK